MSSARFMELALYHAAFGYYERAPRPIGRRGDFFTSVSVGPLFGGLLAFQCSEWLAELEAQKPRLETLHLVEAGAHDGQLAADILGWLQRHRPALLERIEYLIIEPSARRRAWQEETLRNFAPRVRWLEALPKSPASQLEAAPGCHPSPALRAPSPLVGQGETDEVRGEVSANPQSAIHDPQFTGVIFSNELLDAFPVHRLGWDAKNRAWFEWAVESRGDAFEWTRLPLVPDSPLLKPQSAICNPQLQAVLPDGYTIELCPAAETWWRNAALSLARGWLLAIDYGLTDDDWLRPERPHGTLRAYRDHHANSDLLANPGEQDLTAHVNFSAIQRAGESAGMRTLAFEPQFRFLTRALDAARRPAANFGEWTTEQTSRFATLTHPDHLGGVFRVLTQER